MLDPGTPPRGRLRGGYLIGLGLGAIPVALSLIAGGVVASVSGGTGLGTPEGATLLLNLAVLIYVGILLVMIFLLFNRETRPIGLGLLTAVVIGPVVAAVGCAVILSVARPPL